MVNFRESVFWFYDFMNGSKVRKHYNDIGKNLKELSYNYINSNSHLNQLLNYATENVAFYKEYKNKSLNDLPIINKTIIKENYKHFLSSQIDSMNLKKITTSGSTGTPFTVLKDKQKLYRHTAENIYFNKEVGSLLGQKLYYFRVWNNINRKNFFQSFLENLVMIDISSLSIQNIEGILRQMKKDPQPKSLLAFASSLIELSKADLSNANQLNVQVIVAISENLPREVRMKLEEAFRCPVVSRYSNMENGFIANQRKGELEYRINTASFIVEILDMNSDKVVPEGSVGRIVVTDLFNKAMPLIRYDTGDIGSKVIINGEQYLNTIEGRKTDLIYNTNGLPVSVHIISNTMWEYDDLNQYQFIQVGKEHYIMKLNFDGDFTKEKQLEEKLKSYLGNNANIVFEYVKEIPVLHSGKRKYIANEYYKD